MFSCAGHPTTNVTALNERKALVKSDMVAITSDVELRNL